MEIITHTKNGVSMAEISSNELVIKDVETAKQLMADLYYQGFDRMILHSENITPDFFELKTGLAGEILQTFTNYRMGLTIAGNVNEQKSKSLADFIRESNKLGNIVFVNDVNEWINKITVV